MPKIFLRFYEELNRFLSEEHRKKRFKYNASKDQSIKDIIESCGVPHTQVDLIIVDGKSVDFDYHPRREDSIAIYPVFESININKVTVLRPEPLRDTKFYLDDHLKKLTRYLRMLGFDCKYRKELSTQEFIREAQEQKRIILSRNRGLLKRKAITHGYCLVDTDPKEQLFKVLNRFDLFDKVKEFSRCFLCNTKLKNVKKSKIVDRLPSEVKKYQQEFTICPNCDKLYWKGTHFQEMVKFINMIKSKEEK